VKAKTFSSSSFNWPPLKVPCTHCFWTLIHNRYYVHINKHCSYCGAVETDQHLFFKCNLPTDIWSAANSPLITSNIPVEEDGVQVSIPLLITPNPIDETLCKTLFFSRTFEMLTTIIGSRRESGLLSRFNRLQMLT